MKDGGTSKRRGPPGSEEVAEWARRRLRGYELEPDPSGFHRWTPLMTMVAPEHYFNAVSWPLTGGGVAVAVEPWLALVDSEPLERTLLLYLSHPVFRHRAAARHGEHFNTRVVVVDGPRWPEVALGDAAWDAHLTTLAPSLEDARGAFPSPVRELMLEWRFAGHVEIRPGGCVLHFAGARPTPSHLERSESASERLVRRYLRAAH